MPMKKKIINTLLIITTVILLLITSILVYKNVVFFNAIVVGQSMHGTLEEGEVGYVRRIQFVDTIKRGDIIVFEKNESYEVVKRVIGVPGDYIKLNNNVVYVNGSPIEENYLLDENKENITNKGNIAYYEVKLGQDEYYVMGDNRKNSLDSRFYGAIKKNQITGKLRLIYAQYDCSSECETYTNRRLISWRFF